MPAMESPSEIAQTAAASALGAANTSRPHDARNQVSMTLDFKYIRGTSRRLRPSFTKYAFTVVSRSRENAPRAAKRGRGEKLDIHGVYRLAQSNQSRLCYRGARARDGGREVEVFAFCKFADCKKGLRTDVQSGWLDTQAPYGPV